MNNIQMAAGAKKASETACSRIHGRRPLDRIFVLIVLLLTDPTTQKIRLRWIATATVCSSACV
jgi:hypothetical protein